jgi:4-amino-4-deoxy-L-arabinose transferase-like glycosyltransferase
MSSVTHKQPLSASLVLIIIGALIIARLIAITISPLDLSVDEAQYWLWSQNPAAGYFTKPPMIAWIIGLGTVFAGSAEYGVRIMAPLLHGITALVLWQVAGRLYHPVAGRIAALGWITLPAVGLGSFIISTDTPLLLFTSTMLLALSPLAQGRSPGLFGFLLAGIMLGLGLLSKYAAIFSLMGMIIFWLSVVRDKTPFRLRDIAAMVLAALIVVSPNLIWNIQHGFSTITHLGDNANIDHSRLAFDLSTILSSLASGLSFLVAQFGVIGPVVMLAFLGSVWGAVWGSVWGKDNLRHRFLLSFILPPLVIITLQAIISEANANWAVLAWPPALVMLAGWCCDNEGRIRKPVWLITMAASNITLAVVIWLVSVTGYLGVLTPPSDPLRHLRGWDKHHTALIALISDHPVKMIITDRRGAAALMTHALRDSDLTVTIIDADGRPSNHFEASHPYQSRGKGDQVILMTEVETPPEIPDINWIGTIGESRVSISQTRNRHLYFHLGIESPSD